MSDRFATMFARAQRAIGEECPSTRIDRAAGLDLAVFDVFTASCIENDDHNFVFKVVANGSPFLRRGVEPARRRRCRALQLAQGRRQQSTTSGAAFRQLGAHLIVIFPAYASLPSMSV